MRKTDLVFGALIAIITTAIASYFFITLKTKYSFVDGVLELKQQGILGKIITLGAVLNILIFFLLLKLNKEMMARGIVLGIIIMAIVTLFV
jgi:uncharacterized membrane protein